MAFLNSFFTLLKTLAILILIMAIAIPLRYGSTNRQHLQIRFLHSILSVKNSLLPDRARPSLSADYRAFEDILRMRSSPKHDVSEDLLIKIKDMRSAFDMSILIPIPSQCRIDKEVFEHEGHTVDAYWIDNHQKNLPKETDRILLYMHGGGYMAGDIHGYSGIECHLSQLFNITILHLEYRLNPEHSLTAAVDDSVAIYRALLRSNISPSQLVIMGDSAGGGLALLTIQAIVTHQLPPPRGVIALSPWTDLSSSGESYTRNHLTDVMLTTDHIKWMVKVIMSTNHPELSPDSPIVSPLFGSFEGFPPMYINVGTAEVAEDNSRAVVKKAEDTGINVTFEVGLHLMHVYPLLFPYYPEARNTLNNINKWMQTIFDQKLNV